MVSSPRAVSNDQPEESTRPRKRVRCERTPKEVVRSLQARIVKATEQGRWNKVKALQYRLARSHSARVLAVERVTQNKGGKTPGVDGAT